LTRRGANAGNAGRGMHWIRDKKRRRIYWRDGFRCVWCQRSDAVLCLDHVLPRAKGGSNDAGNLVTSCLACNEARGDTVAVTFAFRICDGDGVRASIVLDRVIDAMGAALPGAQT
jgi:5-methylcytosine-specific restriction endonuclease McrA